MGFIIEDMYMTDSGNLVSHGFYAGKNPKYSDTESPADMTVNEYYLEEATEILSVVFYDD